MIDKAGLEDLWADIREEPRFEHLRLEGIRLVPGYGASEPLAMVIGEAPGAQENDKGRPFVGPSGRVLHQLMALAGLRADWRGKQTGARVIPGCKEGLPPNVWLTNTIKFRPPGNRTPDIREIDAARPYLRREWTLIGRPRLIVAVGAVATEAFNAHPVRMLKGELYPLSDNRTWICYQYHPAYGLRGGPERQDMLEAHWEEMGRQIKEMREELKWL